MHIARRTSCSTCDSGVLSVVAVVHGDKGTVYKSAFRSAALNVVQQDLSSSGSEECLGPGDGSEHRVSKLPADDRGFSCIPQVIADGAPSVTHAHFHASFVELGAAHQADVTVGAALASDASVFTVVAVVSWVVGAGEKCLFVSYTANVIDEDGTSSSAEECK